jgi:hypothetical protein
VNVTDIASPEPGESDSALGDSLRELLSKGYEVRAVKRLDGAYQIVATGTLGSAITGEDDDFYTALAAVIELAGL